MESGFGVEIEHGGGSLNYELKALWEEAGLSAIAICEIVLQSRIEKENPISREVARCAQ